ncbi:MAG: hypothetical protein EBR82_48120 [Caulobacteraceae bacterium]|nr:hypothetical protein [Caulobacteraceae bacterium]
MINHGIDGTMLDTRIHVGKVDVVIVPEVIEHVTNVEQFLDDIAAVDADTYVFTAPCAMQCAMRGHFSRVKHTVLEIVHEDHKCWYSPYTLANALKNHFDVKNIFWNNNISVGAICSKK